MMRLRAGQAELWSGLGSGNWCVMLRDLYTNDTITLGESDTRDEAAQLLKAISDFFDAYEAGTRE